MSRIADPKAKSALLRAAEDVFAARGVAGAKIEDITRCAGLSKGAFYLHFESKEAAVQEIAEAWLARCTAFFAAPAEYPDTLSDADAILDFCIERDVQLYEFLWETRATIRLLHGCRIEFVYLLDAFKSDIQARNRAWLAQWRQEGFLRAETDVDLAVVLISGAYEALTIKLIKSDVQPPLEQWLEFAQETFMRAFGTPELVAALDRRSRGAVSGIQEPSGGPGARARAPGRG
ncbi:MAG: TetR/AcrR family transcriptional regulator [Labilithrix sp.]|nr:TetR/AcrR family transcriptional regulator [Labilithrix sp.]MCW5835622.1 TetR/AcrR family transcriptional regulator [Labilithrix sp.]